jgi:hypothetical protein
VFCALGDFGKQFAQARGGLPGMGELPLPGDGLGQWGKQLPAQNRCNEDEAACIGKAAVDGKPAAGAQKEGSGGKLEEARCRSAWSRKAASLFLGGKHLHVGQAPAAQEGGLHAHGNGGWRRGEALGGTGLGEEGGIARLGKGGRRAALPQPPGKSKRRGKARRHPAQPRLDPKDGKEEHHAHRHIQEGAQHGAGHEAAGGLQVGGSLGACARPAAQHGLEGRIEHAPGKLLFRFCRHPGEDARPCPFQGFQDGVYAQHQHGEHQQGHGIAAVDHPVINLKHINGGGKAKAGDAKAKKGHLPPGGGLFKEGGLEGGGRRHGNFAKGFWKAGGEKWQHGKASAARW